jgi:bacterial translation initiation factor 3 (bIF-3)
MATSEALALAQAKGLDLVEVSPNADPPVCRIMDYGKFKYEQQKRQQEAKKKQTVIQIKEVKFRPKTDEHDYQTKAEAHPPLPGRRRPVQGCGVLPRT